MASANNRLKTAQTTTGDTPQPRQRPKDRRDQIIRVAAESFSKRGYFGTGVDQIAGEVGISGPALYRHFPNKYALFSETVRTLGADLERVVEVVPEIPDDPERELRLLITELTRTTIDNRSRGALYRSEARFLTQPDRQVLGEMVGRVHTRFATPLGRMRPELTKTNPTITGWLNTDARYLSGSLLSVIASITMHRASLPRKRMEAIIMSAAMTVARTELPPVEAAPVGDDAAGPGGMAMASKREALLGEAIRLMRGRGFHDVTMEEIGAAVGMNQSGVYRHFDTKVAMLTAAFQRASERLTAGSNAATLRNGRNSSSRSGRISTPSRHGPSCTPLPTPSSTWGAGNATTHVLPPADASNRSCRRSFSATGRTFPDLLPITLKSSFQPSGIHGSITSTRDW